MEDLLATRAFRRLAQTVYAPLKAWAEQAEIEALPDAPEGSEEGELA
jgi:exodeoxyribonuclease V gamma subunit